jgi:hypothetical protein
MAGTIIADTLTHSTAGSVTTDYVVNGSAKAWVNFDAIGTVAIRDSHNVSSITDNGTGDFSTNYSNSFNAVEYAMSGGAGQTTGDPNRYVGFFVPTSASFSRFVTQYPPVTPNDGGYNAINVHGDLA